MRWEGSIGGICKICLVISIVSNFANAALQLITFFFLDKKEAKNQGRKEYGLPK
jgi:hypothetical protein